jgi:hypothetical protein
MTDKLSRTEHDHDTPFAPSGSQGSPGKVPVTARIPSRGTTNIVLRVESAEAARELAGTFGPRDANGVAAGADEAVSRAAGSSGSPLPDGLRSQFESSLGADLSSVRVHTGEESAQAAKAVGARAYTTGQDIHFGAGHYNPSSAFGVHLLAHEVAHTVQQAGAAPTMQHKLEVSTPGDAAEVEADRAADAMVAGEQVRVGSALGLSRSKLMRDQVLPPIEISGGEDESIKDTIHNASSNSQNKDDAAYTWGSGSLQTTDEGGKPIENDQNPLVKNAKRNGSIEKLRQISSELDIVKPPVVAWKAAMAACVAAGNAGGINPDNPMSYKNDFKRMKTELDKGETGPMGKVLSSLRTAQQARQKTALLGLKAAIKSLESAKAKFEGHKAYLQQLAAQEEVKKNAEDLAKIKAQIETAVHAITYTAKAVSVLAGGIGALEAGTVTLMDNDPNSGVEVKGTPALPGGVKSGADAVSGAEGMLTKFFELTLWKSDLDKIKAKETELNAQIASLTTKGIQQKTVAVTADLDAATAKAEEAKQNKEDADREFHNAIIQAGRNFDQRKMSDEEKSNDTVDPKAHVKGENSMEGLMAVYSCIVKRAHSRSALLKAAEGCPTLRLGDAKQIVAQVMDSGKIAKGEFAKTDIDHPDNAGESGVDHIVAGMVGDQFKQGIAMAIAHIKTAQEYDAAQAANEAQWDSLVAMGTSGLIGGQT